MRSKATTVILTALIFATVTLTASAQIPLNMSYQARLANSTGNPVPDSSYDMEFRFYSDSTGGVPVWTESFFDVFTDNGFFDVFLEMDLDNLDGPLFMEIMVGDEIMSPRAPMATAPFSAIAQRMQGDIITNEGYMVLTNADGDSSFSILSDAVADLISVKMAHPPEGPGINILADGIANSINFRLVHPPEMPSIEMSADAAQSSFKMMDPTDEKVGFDVFIGGEGNSLKLMDPSDDEVPVGVLQSDGFETSLKLIDPSDDEVGFDVFIGAAGNSMKLIDPSDDENSLIEMNGGIGGDASIIMNNLSGLEVGPLLEMTTDPTASSRIKIHAAQPTFSGRVEIQAQFTDGANMTMFREGLVPHNEIKAMDLRVGSDIGGELNIFNYASDVEQELLAISGSPSSGASIKMFNPQPEPPAEPLLEMNTDQYGASIAMAAPQSGGSGDQITDPLFEVTADSTGGAINLHDDIGRYLGLEPMPFTPGGIFRMYSPVSDAVKFEVYTSADGGGVGLYDDIGKYMGFEPSPFIPGGFVYLIDPSSGDTTISLDTHGYIQVDKGITLGPNANNGELNLVAGTGNTVNGWYNIVSGYGSQCDYNNNFIWADYPVGPAVIPVQSSGNNQFLVRATGAVKFYTNANLTSGVQLTPGASSWSSITTLDGVRNLKPVDSKEILNKIERLPINRYSYKSEDESVEHIGPMAADFHNQFGLGTDNEHISAQDQSGIALAGIKEMINIINELKDKNAELERRIAELERTR
ncbi:MAG: hypothetical protein JSU85_10075 [Candidatus Zixiibacteriota bacterium]|nr:MAG: hypothetical protein JSU85_10075 [candidate division Zixibacteria bacterium]